MTPIAPDARLSGASTSLVLDLCRELSPPTSDDRCTCENRVFLRSDLAEVVKARGKCVNQCDYCAGLAARENTEMLSLDAASSGNAPEVWLVLTTRTATVEMAQFYKAREHLVRALRRRWPALEYASCLEYTTGYGPNSGGERRPHWNVLLKGVTIADMARIREIVDRVWCPRIDADPVGQHVGAVRDKGGLMKYIASHFQKASQRPPSNFRGQRFNCSRGYFGEGVTRRVARNRARCSLRLGREFWRAEQQGLTGFAALRRAEAECREADRRVWVCCTKTGVPRGSSLRYRPKQMMLPSDRRKDAEYRFARRAVRSSRRIR